jgi:hypothetical protein
MNKQQKACKIITTMGKEFKIFFPLDADNAQTERIIRTLSDHFDVVISGPAKYQVGFENEGGDNHGVEVTAIRKRQSDSETEFRDIDAVLGLVWPEHKEANRPILRGAADDIVIRELHCERPRAIR